MANNATLKAQINASIKFNGLGDITGNLLNTILNAMVDTLGHDYSFAGIATENGTPGTPDNNIFYLAVAAGTYTNYGGFTIDGTTLRIFTWNGSWANLDTGVPTATGLSAALALKADKDADAVSGDVAIFDASGNPVDGGVALDKLAKVDGYYTQLVSGAAENIVGRSSVPASFLFRTTGGSADVGTGAAQIKKLGGNGLVWNQMVAADATEVTIASGHKYFARIAGVESIATSDGTPISVTGGTDIVVDLTKLFNGSVPEGYSVDDFKHDFPLPYYAYNAGEILTFAGQSLLTTGANLYNHATGKANLPQVDSAVGFKVQGTYTALSFLPYGETTPVTITPDANGQFTTSGAGELTITGGNDTDTMVYVYWSQKDLDFVAYEEHTFSFPDFTAITGKVNGQGASEVMFGEVGLCKAGSVDNYLIADADGWARRGRKRLARVNLGGDLEWQHDSNNIFVSSIIGTAKKPSSGYEPGNIVCSKYVPTGPQAIVDNPLAHDKSIGLYISGVLYVSDSAYSDAATFKAAMDGVYLIYELETPVDYVLDTPINLGIYANDLGTERILPANGDEPYTAPSNFDVQYALNAADMLTNLVRNYMSINANGADESSMKALAGALSTALGIAISWTWDEATRKYTFAVADNRAFKVVAVPASASATGTAGNIAYDADYLYICVATDTWKRVAIATW